MNYPYRGACANYLCAQNGCQGHCGWAPRPTHYLQPPRGCICPPESEKTCQGFCCPRKGFVPAQAMSAGTAETPKGGSGRKPASAVGKADAS